MATSETSKTEAQRPAASSTAAGAKKPAGARPRAARHDEDESIPVIGGRFLIAALILGALTVIPMSKLGDYLEPADPPGADTSTWQVGAKTTLILTLVTADANALTCASPQEFEGKHCAYKTQTEAWPRDPTAPLDENK